MEKKYEQNRDSTKAIEFGDASLRNSVGHVSAASEVISRGQASQGLAV